VLHIGERNNGVLTLKGTEAVLASLPYSHDISQRFFGRSLRYPMDKITAFGVGMMQGPSLASPPNPMRETIAEYYTNNVLIGDHIENEEHPFIIGALITLTGLQEWCDSTGFLGKYEWEAKNITLSHQATISPYYDLGSGRSLRFLSQYAGPVVFGSSKKVTMEERNSIELSFSQNISINDLLSELHIWQTFITVGLRRPSYLGDIRLRSHNGDASQLFVPGGRNSHQHNEDGLHPRGALLTQSKLGTKLAEYVKAWRQRHDTIGIAVLLFSGTTYEDDGYGHTHLLTYLQVLEIIHRESFRTDRFPSQKMKKSTLSALREAVPKILTAALQKQIAEQIGFIGTLTLLDRLNHLYSIYKRSLHSVFPAGEADMKVLKDTRNFLTHYGQQKTRGKEFLYSQEMYILKEKTRLFVEICLLGAIGMNEEEIWAMMRQFEPYREFSFATVIDRVNKL
jgi:hypothetical protein